nr:formyltransferase family protein [Rubricella aquisinus]
MLGLIPEYVLFLGEDGPAALPSGPQNWDGVFLPDLSEPATATCARAGIPVTRIAAPDVNDPAVRDVLRRQGGGVTLYAGLGGQIVSKETLECGVRFLHLHSGSLPEYRGSTTLYYALLNGQAPAVSAIWLDPQIDTGPVLARQSYPIPASGMDVDRLYDASIRADLMGRIVGEIARHGADHLTPQPTEGPEGVYYVIHPILKHIALMALSGTRAQISAP